MVLSLPSAHSSLQCSSACHYLLLSGSGDREAMQLSYSCATQLFKVCLSPSCRTWPWVKRHAAKKKAAQNAV